jgi:SAM-dependent methyltransferase
MMWRNTELAIQTAPKLAFGAEPSHRRFRLRFARYAGLTELVATRAAAAPGRTLRVLDAGCGRGRLPRYYRSLQGSAAPVDFVGVDVSVDRLEGAKGAGYRVLSRGSIEKFPFRDGTFDGLVCEQVVEHFTPEQMPALLGDFKRVMRPGAFLIVGVPVFTSVALALKPVWTVGQRVVNRFSGATPAHKQHFSVRSMSRLLTENGLEVQLIQGYRLFSLPNGWLEDSASYYRAHRWAGRHAPGLCSEADFLCVRR